MWRNSKQLCRKAAFGHLTLPEYTSDLSSAGPQASTGLSKVTTDDHPPPHAISKPDV